jgi:hypothetical protein
MKPLPRPLARTFPLGLSLLCCPLALRATTELQNSGFPGSNQALPGSPNYGSNVAGDGVNWTATTGAAGVMGTPNIKLIWDGEGGGSNSNPDSKGLDTYTGWDGRGSVIQLDGTGSGVNGAGTPNTFISFVPAQVAAVKLLSFDLDAWSGWPAGGNMTVEWAIRDTTKTGAVLASGTWTRDSGGRDTVAPAYTGSSGQTLVLQLTRSAGNGDYLALDNLIFDEISAAPSITSFTSAEELITGSSFDLNWEIARMVGVTSLTLSDGTTTTSVLPFTSTSSGVGTFVVNPTGTTTYTLTVNGTLTRQVRILGGRALSFTTNATLATAPDYDVPLSWEIAPANAALVTISDGTTTYNVTADTDPLTGVGTRAFTVPSASTTFTLEANSSGVQRTVRVFRQQASSADFAVSAATFNSGAPVVVTWANAAAGLTDWIGIYRIGDTPGPVASTQWNYLNGTRTSGGSVPAGSMSFNTLAPGEYFTALFLNDGYTFAKGPVLFTVLDTPAEPAALPVISVKREGGHLTLEWASQAGHVYDIYTSADLLGNPLQDWTPLADDLPAPEAAATATATFTEDLGVNPPATRFYRIYEYISP